MCRPRLSRITVALASLVFLQASQAGGFSLYTEGTASAIGNFAAGIAAEAVDASTGWYNPAGLVRVKKQESIFSGVGVFPSTKLSGTSTYITEDLPPYTQTFQNLQGGVDALVPAFHYVKPLGDRSAFGVSIVSPFGLSTNWGEDSPVRYAATLTKLLTVTLSPEIAGLLTDHTSFGLGLDLQWARVNFNSVLGSPAGLQYLESLGVPVTPTTLDSTTDNQGHSFGIGFHAGLLTALNQDHTRIGLNYQSRVSHQFTGASTLVGPLADPDVTNPFATFRSDTLRSNAVELPYIITLSGYQDVTSRVAILGSIVYTGWNSFKAIKLYNVAAFSSDTSTTALVNTTSTENYRDVWRFALGANVKVTELWLVRIGGGYDQTPTVNSDRDIRLPDANRVALSIGSHYQVRPNIGLDIGYTYLFAPNDAIVNKLQPLGTLSTYQVNARGQVYAQLAGLQVVWIMD